MTDSEHALRGQVIRSAAEVYDTFFVPALFGQWPERVLDTAGLRAGDDVLDVGCGTGILARAAARRLAGTGSVTGVDINDGMLGIARRSTESVAWHSARAESLPFPDRSFDHVISQFALMFLTDQAAGLREMVRVARPGATITIATWASIDRSPGYLDLIGLLGRLFGDGAVVALGSPFTLGTEADLRRVVGGILPDATTTTLDGEARFDSLTDWLHTEIRGWTLADMIDDRQFDELLATAKTELAHLVDHDGRVRFAAPALITTATVPEHGRAVNS